MADLWSPRRLILVGWTCYAAVYVGFAFAASAWHVWALFLAYAGFFAVTEPAEKKLVSAFVPEGQSGAAFGWFHTALGLANLPSSLLFGWLYEHYGVLIAFGWGAFAAAVAAMLLATIRMERSL
jgi:predicted MFS family arabinose efflux permease